MSLSDITDDNAPVRSGESSKGQLTTSESTLSTASEPSGNMSSTFDASTSHKSAAAVTALLSELGFPKNCRQDVLQFDAQLRPVSALFQEDVRSKFVRSSYYTVTHILHCVP